MGVARGETTFAVSLCVSGPATIVVVSPELTVIGVDLNGTTVSTDPQSALDGLFYHFVGVSRTLNGKIDARGFGKLTDTDGDAIYTETTAIGPLSKPDWTSTFTQGTGKWKGITGSAEVSPITRRPPLAEGKYRGCYLMQGSFNIAQ
jgi:hypothetical protein